MRPGKERQSWFYFSREFNYVPDMQIFYLATSASILSNGICRFSRLFSSALWTMPFSKVELRGERLNGKLTCFPVKFSVPLAACCNKVSIN